MVARETLVIRRIIVLPCAVLAVAFGREKAGQLSARGRQLEDPFAVPVVECVRAHEVRRERSHQVLADLLVRRRLPMAALYIRIPARSDSERWDRRSASSGRTW
jgi:hypothetical protein